MSNNLCIAQRDKLKIRGNMQFYQIEDVGRTQIYFLIELVTTQVIANNPDQYELNKIEVLINEKR